MKKVTKQTYANITVREKRKIEGPNAKEISEDDFIQMEENSKKAEHFGSEILGIIRVPVYFWREKGGFPTFLTNAFACTAKPQLLLALYKNGILTKEYNSNMSVGDEIKFFNGKDKIYFL